MSVLWVYFVNFYTGQEENGKRMGSEWEANGNRIGSGVKEAREIWDEVSSICSRQSQNSGMCQPIDSIWKLAVYRRFKISTGKMKSIQMQPNTSNFKKKRSLLCN